jgi:uncharacterized protein YxeA
VAIRTSPTLNNKQKKQKTFMKKLLVILLAVTLVSFAAEKFIVIRMPEDKMNYHWQNLNNAKQIINSSNLPHQQALFLLTSIDSLQKDIQSTASIDSLSKK